jgi:hypothetical protein
VATPHELQREFLALRCSTRLTIVPLGCGEFDPTPSQEGFAPFETLPGVSAVYVCQDYKLAGGLPEEPPNRSLPKHRYFLLHVNCRIVLQLGAAR